MGAHPAALPFACAAIDCTGDPGGAGIKQWHWGFWWCRHQTESPRGIAPARNRPSPRGPVFVLRPRHLASRQDASPQARKGPGRPVGFAIRDSEFRPAWLPGQLQRRAHVHQAPGMHTHARRCIGMHAGAACTCVIGGPEVGKLPGLSACSSLLSLAGLCFFFSVPEAPLGVSLVSP